MSSAAILMYTVDTAGKILAVFVLNCCKQAFAQACAVPSPPHKDLPVATPSDITPCKAKSWLPHVSPDYLVKTLFLPWDAQLHLQATPTPTRVLQLSQRSLLIFEFPAISDRRTYYSR